MSPSTGGVGPELARSQGFLAVASDGLLGHVEMPLVPPEDDEPDYLVVRTGRFLRVRHPVISTALVVGLDTRRRRVYLRGQIAELADVDEQLPLAV